MNLMKNKNLDVGIDKRVELDVLQNLHLLLSLGRRGVAIFIASCYSIISSIRDGRR